MEQRQRYQVLADVVEPYACTSLLTGTHGNCSTGPSPLNTPWINGASGTYQRALSHTTVDDVVIPNYFKRSRMGEVFCNPYKRVRYNSGETPSTLDIGYMCSRYGCEPSRLYSVAGIGMTGEYSLSGLYGSSLFLPAPEVEISNLVDRATSTAWARIGHDKMLVLATIAEMDSSIVGLTYILKKVYKILRAVKRRQLRALKRQLSFEDLQEIYMNARYNLRPLYYDVKAVMGILTTPQQKPGRQTFRASLTASDEKHDEICKVVFNHSGYVSASLCLNRMASTHVSVRAGVLTQVDLRQYLQLWGVDKLAETAWDLVPYSFIAGWFTNISDVISSFVPVMGYKALTSWVVVDSTTVQSSWTHPALDTTITERNGWVFANRRFSASVGNAHRIISTRVRTPNVTRPLIPSWNVRLSVPKLLDLGVIAKKLRATRG